LTITRCTITGLDDLALVPQVNALFRHFPFLEIGILFSANNAGQDRRFPSIENIQTMIETLDGNIALHICGRSVEDVITDNQASAANLLARHPNVGRIQLNLNARAKWLPSPEIIDNAINDLGKPVIIQENAANHELNRRLTAPNHQLLFDSSGGLGKAADVWPAIIPGKSCGFAGGLGPDTITQEIPRIEAVAGLNEIWIDMEGRVRTDENWLDLEKVRVVLGVVADHSRERAAR